MTPALIYWLLVAALGFAAALGSFWVGLGYYRHLRRERPELVRSYWPEVLRDALLVIGLAANLLTGVLAAMGPIRSGIGLVAVLSGATCLSFFAIFNFALRSGR